MNPDLVALPFDHYQRYGAAAALLSGMGGEPIARVLEVGANRQRILKSFMPDSHFVFSDLEAQESVAESDDIFVQADATRLPFSDQEFDAVVSLDVMEHIPKHLRALATEQMSRVARRCVVIGCPLDLPWVHEAEAKANSVWERYFGESYPWLEEHKEFGLVDPDVVVSTLQAAGFHVIRFGQGDVDIWEGMMASHFIKEAVHELAGIVSAADRLYNESVFAGDRSARAYREFFVGVRNDDDYAKLKASSFLNAEPNPSARTLLSRFSDRLVPVVDRLKLTEREWQSTADFAHQLEDKLREETGTRLHQEAERARLMTEHEELCDRYRELREEHKKLGEDHQEVCEVHQGLRAKHQELSEEHKGLREERQELREEHKELRGEHEMLCRQRQELLDLVGKSQEAADRAHLEVFEMARAGRSLADSAALLRDRADRLVKDQGELEAQRQLLAGRVVTLERRQRIAKLTIGLVGICSICIFLYQMIR
jgi:hypothetical protein